MHWPNLDQLSPHDEVKFVIADRADFDYARRRRRGAIDLAARAAAVLFSPVHGVLAPATLARWILDERLPARLQLQAHKYIWSPGDAGRVMADVAPSSCSPAGSIRRPPRRWRAARAVRCTALTVRYGQVHAREIEAARRVAAALGFVAPRRDRRRPRARSADRRSSATARFRKDRADSTRPTSRRPTCRRATP